jgi:hypothetical protein
MLNLIAVIGFAASMLAGTLFGSYLTSITDMSGGEWIGTVILVFWCIYFAPISILSFLHFKNKIQV